MKHIEYKRLPASTSITELRAYRAEGWDVVVWVGEYLLARAA